MSVWQLETSADLDQVIYIAISEFTGLIRVFGPTDCCLRAGFLRAEMRKQTLLIYARGEPACRLIRLPIIGFRAQLTIHMGL